MGSPTNALNECVFLRDRLVIGTEPHRFLNAFVKYFDPFFGRPFATRGWSTSASSTNCFSLILPDVRKLVELSGISLTSCFFCES